MVSTRGIPHPDPSARDSRPTVLFLIHDLRSGGAERVFLNYVNNLTAARPVAVVIRTLEEVRDELSPDVPLYDLAHPLEPASIGRPDDSPPSTDAQARPGGVLAALSGMAPIALVTKARRLAMLAARTNATVVCAFLHKSNIIALTAKLLFRRRFRVVISMHEMPGPYMGFHFPPLRRAVMRWFTRHGLPRADLIIAVADGVRQNLVHEFGIPPDRIVVVHNPIDLEQIRRSATEPGATPVAGPGPLLVAVGRLVRFKGFDLLIHAMARLPPGLRARLIIIGEGEERPHLERLIDVEGLRGSVQLLGLQRNPWQYMAQADLFVLPSRTEALPNVIIEAFALGLPVLATDCSPGVRELLDGGECGLLVAPDSAAALAAGLARMLGDETLRRRLALLGLERASAFELGARIRHFEEVLGTLLR